MSEVMKSMTSGAGGAAGATAKVMSPVGDAPRPPMSAGETSGGGRAPRLPETSVESGPSPAETAAGRGGKPMDMAEAMKADAKRMDQDPASMMDKRNSAVHGGGQPPEAAGATPSMLDNAAALHNAMIGETKQSVSVAMNVNA